MNYQAERSAASDRLVDVDASIPSTLLRQGDLKDAQSRASTSGRVSATINSGAGSSFGVARVRPVASAVHYAVAANANAVPLAPGNIVVIPLGAGARVTAGADGRVQQGGRSEPSSGFFNFNPRGGALKRLLDIVIAAVALLVLSPLMLMIALGIRLSMGAGPVVFAQSRVGFGGKTFVCYKFRTMVCDGEEILRQHLANRPDAAHEWATCRKLSRDPRVTAFGHILRKSSLDELPQFVNVLLGEMSCVGPRPVVAAELGRYGTGVREYISCRPGLTGLWQIGGRNSRSYADRVALDRFYARRWSLKLDLAILAGTIPAVLRFGDTA